MDAQQFLAEFGILQMRQVVWSGCGNWYSTLLYLAI